MQRHPHHFKIALALAFSAGAWGIYWLPQRTLEAGGLTGGWGTIAQMVIGVLLLLPIALWRVYKKKRKWLRASINWIIGWRWFYLLCTKFSINRCNKSFNTFLHDSYLDYYF